MMESTVFTVSPIRLFLVIFLGIAWHLPSPVSATVITFNSDGEAVVHEAVDYRYPDDSPAGLKSAVMLRAVHTDFAPRYENLIRDAASDYDNIDFHLLNSLVAQESAYEPCAVSDAGAMGLAQLMPDTALRLGVTDRCDPVQSVRAGAKELSRTIEKFGSLSLGLAAYNASDEAVIKYGGIPPYEETQDYVVKILSRIIAAQEQQKQTKD